MIISSKSPKVRFKTQEIKQQHNFHSLSAIKKTSTTFQSAMIVGKPPTIIAFCCVSLEKEGGAHPSLTRDWVRNVDTSSHTGFLRRCNVKLSTNLSGTGGTNTFKSDNSLDYLPIS